MYVVYKYRFYIFPLLVRALIFYMQYVLTQYTVKPPLTDTFKQRRFFQDRNGDIYSHCITILNFGHHQIADEILATESVRYSEVSLYSKSLYLPNITYAGSTSRPLIFLPLRLRLLRIYNNSIHILYYYSISYKEKVCRVRIHLVTTNLTSLPDPATTYYAERGFFYPPPRGSYQPRNPQNTT